jgi:hypothetical protein
MARPAITVLMTEAEAPQYAAALGQQMEIAQAILDGLGYAGPHLQLLRVSSLDELTVALQHAPRGPGARPSAPASTSPRTSATRSTMRSTTW